MRFSVFLVSLVTVLAAVGITVSVRVLFKITVVSVEGSSVYANADIVRASGIKTGGSLFEADTAKAEKSICSLLPYIKIARVKRVPFSTVEITVVPETAAEKIASGGGFVLISRDRKVLEVGVNRPELKSLPTLTGIQIKSAVPGCALQTRQPAQLSALDAFNAACAADGIDIGKFTKIDLTDTYQISLLYGGRVNILVGTSGNLDYKLKSAVYILSKKLGAAETGKLDVSNAEPGSGDAYRIYFDAS